MNHHSIPAILAGLCLSVPGVDAAVLRVPSDFPTIQQAVNAAAAGDTVVVSGGRYPEAVTLKGRNPSPCGRER